MDLRSYLDRTGVRYSWSHHPTTYTGQNLAEIEHTSGKKVVKPVVVEADGCLMLCALPAAFHIDLDQLRRELNANSARILEEDEIRSLFAGCDIGAEPPIGKLFGLPTLLDDSVQKQPEVLFQAGTHEDAVRMNTDDFIRITEPTLAHFASTR